MTSLVSEQANIHVNKNFVQDSGKLSDSKEFAQKMNFQT